MMRNKRRDDCAQKYSAHPNDVHQTIIIIIINFRVKHCVYSLDRYLVEFCCIEDKIGLSKNVLWHRGPKYCNEGIK